MPHEPSTAGPGTPIAMTISHQAGAAYIYLRPYAQGEKAHRTEQVGNLAIDLDADGKAIGIELLSTSDYPATDWTRLEIRHIDLPT